jgi:hypothetical protein
MARPRGELAVAHGAQLPAERLLGDRDAELLEDPLCQIDQPPMHQPGTAGIGPTLDHAGDGLALDVVELGRLLYRSIAGMACAWLRRNVHQVGDGGPRCRIMPSLTKRDIPSANRPETLRDASARSCRAERRG